MTASRTMRVTVTPVSIRCISLSFVRAEAVGHALPVRLAPVLGAVAVAAGARLVRLAPRPGRARPGLGGLLAGAVAGPPGGEGFLAPGGPPRGRGLPLALPLGRRRLPLA